MGVQSTPIVAGHDAGDRQETLKTDIGISRRRLLLVRQIGKQVEDRQIIRESILL